MWGRCAERGVKLSFVDGWCVDVRLLVGANKARYPRIRRATSSASFVQLCWKLLGAREGFGVGAPEEGERAAEARGEQEEDEGAGERAAR